VRPPPRLFLVYCQTLGLDTWLMRAWWSALSRSTDPRARQLYLVFCINSDQARWNHDPLFFQHAGPLPLVQLVEAFMAEELLSHQEGNAVIEAILALTTGQDWRGVQMQPRWLREDEFPRKRKEPLYGATCD
jgi:hypothetical protein